MAPLSNKPPHLRVAINLVEFKFTSPQGHSTTAMSPKLVSGQFISMKRSGYPGGGGITVVLEGHPSK